MRSAGLKNITARHIALAIQSLGAIVTLIPHLSRAISIRLPEKQQILLGGFDRLSRDYREHQNELYCKLVGIMQERLVVHCRGLVGIDWDEPDARDFDSEGVSAYIILLVKETSTLYVIVC
jgi:vacuolar protein sorting-associated protein 54